jgi:hypothetical protein
MKYSAPQIVAAFLDANQVAGWSARSYTTEASDFVHFTVPSKLVRVSYDCEQGHFLISFEKLVASWGDYVKAIARSCHYILKTLQAGGLEFTPPDSETAMRIEVRPHQNNVTVVRVEAL